MISKFPWVAPTWPESIHRPVQSRRVGLAYDTAWSRLPAVRAIRAAIIASIGRPLASIVASPAVSGLDRLDVLGEHGAIFAANHASHVDTLIILSALPARFRHKIVVAAGADYFFDRPWKSILSAGLLGGIPVERQKVNRSSSEIAGDLLSKGWSLIIFPEGGRSPDGWAQQFHPGSAAYLSSKWDVPVVPIYLSETRIVLRKGSSRIRRHKTAITFGHPMAPLEGENIRRFGSRVEKSVAELADESSTDWWSARRRAGGNCTPTLSGPQGSPWRRSWSLASYRSSTDVPRWPKI